MFSFYADEAKKSFENLCQRRRSTDRLEQIEPLKDHKDCMITTGILTERSHGSFVFTPFYSILARACQQRGSLILSYLSVPGCACH